MKPFKYNPNNNSGLFRHRITFLKALSVEDEIGQSEIQWIADKQAWSIIKTIKGSEYFSSGSQQAEIISRFIIRYMFGITADMRIDYNGRIFDIIEPPINDDEANKTLTIIAKERV